MSNSNKLSGFNYQTSESTLLGAVENLRMPGMDDLPDYMETFSGVGSMYPTQADLPTFDDNTPSSESDDDSNEQDDADDSSDEQDEVGGLDIFDDGDEDDDMAAGFYGFGQFDGLSADFFDPSARFSGFGAAPPAAITPCNRRTSAASMSGSRQVSGSILMLSAPVVHAACPLAAG